MTTGERLDVFLVRTGRAPSRREARELISRGAIRVNGRRIAKGATIGAGDEIELLQAEQPLALLPDADLPLDVLFEDRFVVIVNKPGLIPCHPLRRGAHGTVMNAITARFPETAAAGDKPLEGGLVHRLDNGTSGALIIARTRESFAQLRAAIRRGAVARRYLALAAGDLDRALDLAAPIAHHRNPRKMTAVQRYASSRSRTALTRVEPIRRYGDFTLVSVAPRTGMRHQIRVHIADAGHPLVGDQLYGGPPHRALASGRFWLHLHELDFQSPAGGRVHVKAPLPTDLRIVLDC